MKKLLMLLSVLFLITACAHRPPQEKPNQVAWHDQMGEVDSEYWWIVNYEDDSSNSSDDY